MDIIKSFMLEQGLFRGTWIAADSVLENIWNKHNYPDVLRPVFQQAVLLALALSAGIKYDGVFSLQIKGNGPVSSLFVDVTTDKKVRGYITIDETSNLKKDGTLADYFGQGQLIFSVAELGKEPYQGIVALNQESLVDTVKDYFRLSEQIDTEIILRQENERGRCLLLQKMPNKEDVSPEKSADLWETVTVLLNSVQNKELFSDDLSPDEVLFRLFHANELTVFKAQTPVFECRCYRGKMESFLKKMNPLDRQNLYNDKGIIETVCQFCGEKYTFQKSDLGD